MDKIAYIQETLADFAQYTEGELAKMLTKKKIKFSDDLLRSLSYKLYAKEQDFSGKYALSFKTYGRFVDMGVGKGVKIETTDSNGKLLRKRYAKKWYGKTVYGIVYGRLMDKLVVNLQTAGIDNIKNALT